MIGLTPDIPLSQSPCTRQLQITFSHRLLPATWRLDRMHGPVFEHARTPEGFADAHVDS